MVSFISTGLTAIAAVVEIFTPFTPFIYFLNLSCWALSLTVAGGRVTGRRGYQLRSAFNWNCEVQRSTNHRMTSRVYSARYSNCAWDDDATELKPAWLTAPKLLVVITSSQQLSKIYTR